MKNVYYVKQEVIIKLNQHNIQFLIIFFKIIERKLLAAKQRKEMWDG